MQTGQALISAFMELNLILTAIALSASGTLFSHLTRKVPEETPGDFDLFLR